MDSTGVQGLKGSWDYVRIQAKTYTSNKTDLYIQIDGENFDEYMKEIGVSWMMRMTAKGIKPRLIISEAGDKWTVRSESTIKTVSYDFVPGVEFDETTPDGREVKVTVLFNYLNLKQKTFDFAQSTINFEGNKWVHTSIDKNGKKSVVTRYVNDEGQQMIVR